MQQTPILYIISDFPDSDDTRRYLDVARTFDAPLKLISHAKSNAVSSKDAAIVRGSARQSNAVVASLRHIESVGAVCLTTSQGWMISKNRQAMHDALVVHDVATPFTTSYVETYLNEYSVPAVIKIDDSNQGKGVAIADTKRSLISFCDVLDTIGRGYVLQEFLSADVAQDERYFVVGDKVIAAMRRTAKADDFRSNLSQGGSAVAINEQSAADELAVRAAKALKLELAGVDIMMTSNGPSVLEVNSSPGLGIEKVTGVDVARTVIERIFELWER